MIFNQNLSIGESFFVFGSLEEEMFFDNQKLHRKVKKIDPWQSTTIVYSGDIHRMLCECFDSDTIFELQNSKKQFLFAITEIFPNHIEKGREFVYRKTDICGVVLKHDNDLWSFMFDNMLPNKYVGLSKENLARELQLFGWHPK